MSIKKDAKTIRLHKETALKKLDKHIEKYIVCKDQKKRSKADKLCYWIEDYCRFLQYEERFDSTKYKRYKRGEVIKAHLGYRIGSEEGGLHYCLVVDKNNSIYSPVVTVVPLTSVKSTTVINPCKPVKGRVNLGTNLYNCMMQKYDKVYNSITKQQEIISQRLETFRAEYQSINEHFKSITGMYISEYKEKYSPSPSGLSLDEVDSLMKKASPELQKIYALALDSMKHIEQSDELFADVKQKAENLKKISNEILKMKSGSIALVNQITTISKIRIYDPKISNDVLSEIKLSDNNLDMVDKEILNLYIGIDN